MTERERLLTCGCHACKLKAERAVVDEFSVMNARFIGIVSTLSDSELAGFRAVLTQDVSTIPVEPKLFGDPVRKRGVYDGEVVEWAEYGDDDPDYPPVGWDSA